MTQPTQKPTEPDALDLLCKRCSKSQDFRSLGDELSTHDSFVLVASIREAQKQETPASNETGAQGS